CRQRIQAGLQRFQAGQGRILYRWSLRGLYGPLIALYKVIYLHAGLAACVRLFEIDHWGVTVPQGNGRVRRHQIICRLHLALHPHNRRRCRGLLRLLHGLIGLPQLRQLVRHRRLIRLVRLIVIGIVRHLTSSFLPVVQHSFVFTVPCIVDHTILQAYHMAGQGQNVSPVWMPHRKLR
ncbi:Membrane-bound metallopeptidase, partial [Dysosmobacter welbionis]